MKEKIQLLHGDFEKEITKIEDNSIDLILTDIPFNISKDNNFNTIGRSGIDFGEWDKGFDIKKLASLQSKLKPGGSLFTFHAFEQYSDLISIFSDLELKDRLIWEKSNPMPRNRDRRYVVNIEIASWYVKPGDKWTFNRQNESYDACVLKHPSENGGATKRYHPCQKAQSLLNELILRHSNKGDTILDPFMGGGSTGIACLNSGRNFIGIELDDNYFNAAKERIDQHQKKIKNNLWIDYNY